MSVVMLTDWVEMEAPLWQPEQVCPLDAGEPDFPPPGPLALVKAGTATAAAARTKSRFFMVFDGA
jgi:hypothetical protein